MAALFPYSLSKKSQGQTAKCSICPWPPPPPCPALRKTWCPRDLQRLVASYQSTPQEPLLLQSLPQFKCKSAFRPPPPEKSLSGSLPLLKVIPVQSPAFSPRISCVNLRLPLDAPALLACLQLLEHSKLASGSLPLLSPLQGTESLSLPWMTPAQPAAGSLIITPSQRPSPSTQIKLTLLVHGGASCASSPRLHLLWQIYMHACDSFVGGLNVCLSHRTGSLRIEALPVLLAAIHPALIISVDVMKGKVDGTRQAGSKEGRDKKGGLY